MNTTSQRVALVTGANKGIGYETALQLGREGCHVLLGARDPARGNDAAEKLRSEEIDVTSLTLDVTDPASVRAAAQHIEKSFGRLDILVNNAGTGAELDGPVSSADLTEVRRIFDTNLLGALEVTQAMLPLLRRAPAARIVNVSSGLGSLARHTDPDWDFAKVLMIGYNGSKAALNMATVLLAKELAGTAIKVNSVAPGFTATDLNGGGPGSQSAAEGAQASVSAALLPDDGPTGSFLAQDMHEPW